MQIGIFENSKSSLYNLMKDLSKELDFTLNIVTGLDDSAMGKIDGLVVQNNLKSANDIARTLKRFKNILLLDTKQAYELLSPELAIICEEAGVELMVSGPEFRKEAFSFIEKHSQSPYYIRILKEFTNLEPITFDVAYRLLYWNAYFSEGEIRKIKINAMPAVNESGILIYGRTESALNIPVDIWLTNLGFETKDLVKVFAQNEVIDLNFNDNTFYCKTKDGVTIENFAKTESEENETYIRSFVEQLGGSNKKNLNMPLPKFLKLVEFYHAIQQKINM